MAHAVVSFGVSHLWLTSRILVVAIVAPRAAQAGIDSFVSRYSPLLLRPISLQTLPGLSECECQKIDA